MERGEMGSSLPDAMSGREGSPLASTPSARAHGEDGPDADRVRPIILTNGGYALVDECDYERVSGYAWRRWQRGESRYAQATIAGKRVKLHRFILLVLPGFHIDHINGDGLDNRRSNLRLCTVSQNQQNRHHLTPGTSRYRGVSWKRGRGKWQATIKHHARAFYLGYYASERDAALAYDEAARRLFGEFARPNFPQTMSADSHRPTLTHSTHKT